jgi:TonB-dependent starch-binding outer membrane protein SusC
METREVRVTGTTINIQLVSAMIGLEEMVVIGYGTVRKSDLTGSVSSIKMDDMKERSITSLEGFFAGYCRGRAGYFRRWNTRRRYDGKNQGCSFR